jgi:hypothetical protein
MAELSIAPNSHSSPAGFGPTSRNPRVIVLRGAAVLELATGELIPLQEGDYLLILPF